MSETSDQINVLVCMDFSDEHLETLRAVSDKLNITRQFPDVPTSAYHDAEILYTLRNYPETPDQAPNLKWIQFHFAGMNTIIDKPIVKDTTIEITSASGIHAIPIAEYCMSLLLAWEYQLPLVLNHQKQALWIENPHEVYRPKTLRGQTLGIVGYGSIARELARLADQFGMKVLATKKNLLGSLEDDGYIEAGTGDPTGDIPERIYPSEALNLMVKDCDYLVVTAPLTPETHHMVNAEVIANMKPSAFIVNIARGALIDEEALITALKQKKIGGAGLDVFEQEPLPKDSPLWALDNVILTPHVSGNNTRYHDRAVALFAENLRRYVDNQTLLNRLNRELGY
jgi:phosphoglycerate dehydrogenase-like enzyme